MASDLERFFGYMQAFELAWLADDWAGLGEHFAPDADYHAVDAGPFGAGGSGRRGTGAALAASTRTIDRRFDVRIPEVIDGPRTRPDGISMRYRLTLRRAGLPDFVSCGDHLATYAGGVIARLVDTPEPGTGARLEAYLAEHGARLRPAGAPLVTDLDPRDLRDLESATARSLVRAYGAAKSEQDVGAALAVCSPDFVLDTPSLGAIARGTDEARAQLGLFFGVFPDYAFAIGGIAAEAGSVACWGRVRMTFAGDLLGLAPTGRTAELPAVSVFSCAGGAIGGERFYLDLAALCAQIGVPVEDMSATLGLVRMAEAEAAHVRAAVGGAR
jgi:predicted ester cyclase